MLQDSRTAECQHSRRFWQPSPSLSEAARTIERAVEDPAVVTFLGNIPEENSWWEAPGGVASVWGRRPKADELSSPSVKDKPFETCLPQRSGDAWRLWDTRDLRSGPSAAWSEVGRLDQGLGDERPEVFDCGS